MTLLAIAFACGVPACTPQQDPARAITGSKQRGESISTQTQLDAAAQALFAQYTIDGRWPTADQGFGAVGSNEFLDAWDEPIRYEPPARGQDRPTITSAGRDNEFGTADDVVYEWRF